MLSTLKINGESFIINDPIANNNQWLTRENPTVTMQVATAL